MTQWFNKNRWELVQQKPGAGTHGEVLQVCLTDGNNCETINGCPLIFLICLLDRMAYNQE